MLNFIRVHYWLDLRDRPRVCVGRLEVLCFIVVDGLVSLYLRGGGQLVVHNNDFLEMI